MENRPTTEVFPVPPASDGGNRVYLSVGHQQMMTDPMKPLGISLWQLTTPAPTVVAAGRIFVDATARLASPSTRASLMDVFGQQDPLVRDALQTVLDRGFVPLVEEEAAAAGPVVPPPAGGTSPIETGPAVIEELIEQNRASVDALEREIRTKSGPALFDFILDDIVELRRILFDPRSHQVFMGAMDACLWLNEQLERWLGEKNSADTLTLSVANNITSEMGLALLDVADVARAYPDVVTFLQRVLDDGFLHEMDGLEGGPQTRDAISGFLDTYGMRCVGEIDITRPRWSERPTMLLPIILGNIRNFGPGASAQRSAHGQRQALAKEHELLERLSALPDGARKAGETKRMIDRARTFIGYREYPKYGMICRYFVYKQALLAEAERLVAAGVLGQADDIFYLTLQELHETVRTGQADTATIQQRRDEFPSYAAFTPPRVLTSDGEALNGAYRRGDAPTGALVGLAVSTGVVEGRARVVRDPADADLEPGDIVVTTFTDPSWTPLFVAIAGLVTEVGGLMTHGAVIAREYGLPAVVGVHNATELIPDGQWVRVNGTDGYVELLPGR